MKATKLIEVLSKKLDEVGDFDIYFKPPVQYTKERHVFNVERLNEDTLKICKMAVLEESSL